MLSPEFARFSIQEYYYNQFTHFVEIQEAEINFTIPPHTPLWPLEYSHEGHPGIHYGDQETQGRLPKLSQNPEDLVRWPVAYVHERQGGLTAAIYVLATSELEPQETEYRIACRDLLSILEKGEYEEVVRLINSYEPGQRMR